SEITIHSLRSNWPGARREGGSVSPAILDRLSNEAPGQFQRNPEGGMSFGRRRCCSLLTDPLRDMLWCPCGSTSRLASAQNPLPRVYSYFGDTTLDLKIQRARQLVQHLHFHVFVNHQRIGGYTVGQKDVRADGTAFAYNGVTAHDG